MNKIFRNLLIVALFTVGGGWMGIWLNNLTGNTQPPMQSLGVLVWLTTLPSLEFFCVLSAGMAGRILALGRISPQAGNGIWWRSWSIRSRLS